MCRLNKKKHSWRFKLLANKHKQNYKKYVKLNNRHSRRFKLFATKHKQNCKKFVKLNTKIDIYEHLNYLLAN